MAHIEVTREKGKVEIHYPNGRVEKLEGKVVRLRSDEKGKKKTVAAFNVMKLLTREFVSTQSETDQDSYFYDVSERVGDYFNLEDIHEAGRLAAAFLQRKRFSAYEIAGMIVETDERFRTAISLGNLSEGAVDNFKSNLASKFVEYFPRNFPKTKSRPQK